MRLVALTTAFVFWFGGISASASEVLILPPIYGVASDAIESADAVPKVDWASPKVFSTSPGPRHDAVPIKPLSGSRFAIQKFEDVVLAGINRQLALFGCEPVALNTLSDTELRRIAAFFRDSDTLQAEAELDPAFILALFKLEDNSCPFGHRFKEQFVLPVTTIASIDTPVISPIVPALNRREQESNQARNGVSSPIPLQSFPIQKSFLHSGPTFVFLDLRGIYY